MATSRSSGHGSRTPFRSFGEGLPDLSRYDVVLAAIPLVFAMVLTAHLALGVSLTTAVTGGSLVNAVAVSDALFVHPPSMPEERE